MEVHGLPPAEVVVVEVVDFLETVAVTAFHLALTIVALEVNHF